MTLENILIVSVILGLCFFGWWFIHRVKNPKNKIWYSPTVNHYSSEPQMGFPIEKGVTDWQKKDHPPVSEFDEVETLLKRISTSPLSLEEKHVPTKNEVVDDPWAHAVAEGLLNKIMPPQVGPKSE